MTTEANKAVVRRYIEEVINQNKLELIDTLFAPQMRDQVRAHLTSGDDAFPDGVEEIRDMVAEGNLVMVWWNFRGTQRGPFFGVPATGKPVDIVGFAVYEFENGQIVDDLMTMDFLGALRQLGASVTLPQQVEA
jgi:steroid delta-isomerase-like uncharacterized protein